MHENGADETGAEDVDALGECDNETAAHDDRANEGNHEKLEAKDEHGSMESVVDLFDIHVKLLHNLPVEGFESHCVSVSA